MLFASDISKGYSGRTLFSGLTLNVGAGDRIALVGPNGSWKTTLLDILAGDVAPETGSVSRQRNVSLGYLKQEPPSFSDKPLLQEVLDANSEVNVLYTMPVADRRRWASRVLTQLEPHLNGIRSVTFLAGRRYREFLEPSLRSRGLVVSIPMEGLRIGEQLRKEVLCPSSSTT